MVTNRYQATFWTEVRKALEHLGNTPCRSPREAQLRAGRVCRQLSHIANSFTPEPLRREMLDLAGDPPRQHPGRLPSVLRPEDDVRSRLADEGIARLDALLLSLIHI